MKITIEDQRVMTKKGVSARTGKPYTINSQEAVFESGRERRIMEVPIDDDQKAYAPGEYEIDEGSFEVSRFGRLEIGRLKLRLVSAAKVKAA